MLKNQYLLGIKSALPIVLGYIPIGFAFGVLANQAQLSIIETGLMSLMVYAGSAQFIGVSMIAAGSSVTAIVFTTFLVNLRHLLMGASLSPHLKSFNNLSLLGISFGITDETFGVASSYLKSKEATPQYMAGLHLTSHMSWILSSLLGASMGNLIGNAPALGLDFALPAMFIALLVMQLKDLKNIIVAIIAALTSILIFTTLPDNWNVIIATIISATLGVMIESWMKK